MYTSTFYLNACAYFEKMMRRVILEVCVQRRVVVVQIVLSARDPIGRLTMLAVHGACSAQAPLQFQLVAKVYLH